MKVIKDRSEIHLNRRTTHGRSMKVDGRVERNGAIPTQILGPLSPASDPTPPKRGPANE